MPHLASLPRQSKRVVGLPNDRIIIAAILFGLCVIGFVRVARTRKGLFDRVQLAIDYLEHLKSYVTSHGNDSEAYGWLVHRSTRMQRQLGSAGIYAAYRPPYARVQYTNYPIILNMLPDLRHALNDHSLQDVAFQYASALQDTLVRHLGTLDDVMEQSDASLRNPIIWLREGVRAVMALPIQILSWLGAISESTVAAVSGGRTFMAISAFSAVIGFVSAVMGIILGWQQFLEMATAWLARLQ